jgi:hypothetical protein
MEHGAKGNALGNNYSGTNNFGLLLQHRDFQWVDNLKWVKGKHTLTMGTDIRRARDHELDNYIGIGTLDFSGKYTGSDPADVGAITNFGPNFGNAIADMLLDR